MIKRVSKKKKYIVLISFCSVAILFIIARYGWRISGFRACSSPYSVHVTVSDSMVNVNGYTVDPFGHYIGYVYKIDDDKLYVGAKERDFIGVIPGDKGSFDIHIPVKHCINEVYWCAQNYQRLEWTRD